MKSLPIYLLLLMTFGLAALDKMINVQVPAWFFEQFKGSLLDFFPGALSASYYAILLLELATSYLLATAIVRREFLVGAVKRYSEYAFFSAQITFIVLGFGQRLTHKYDSAGQLFFYAALTFLASRKLP